MTLRLETRERRKRPRGGNGERGIRTLDTGVNPYAGLANRCLQPLGHLSQARSARLVARLGSFKLLRAAERVNRSGGDADGQGGIRTHETLAGPPVFKTGSFNHSDTCPFTWNQPRTYGKSHVASMRATGGPSTRKSLRHPASDLVDLGNRMTNVEPAPTSLSTSSVPPIRSTRPREIASPSPTPGSGAAVSLR